MVTDVQTSKSMAQTHAAMKWSKKQMVKVIILQKSINRIWEMNS